MKNLDIISECYNNIRYSGYNKFGEHKNIIKKYKYNNIKK